MNLAADQVVAASDKGSSPKTRKKSTKTARKPLRGKILKVAGLVLLIVLILGLPASFVFAYNNRIYPNIKIAGVQVGGMSKEEAKTALADKAKEFSNQPLNLVLNDQAVNPRLEELGISFDVDKAIDAAYSIGRLNGYKDRISQTWGLVKQGFRIELAISVDEKKLDFYIDTLSNTYTKKPVNATLSIQNGNVYLVPAQKGYGLDKAHLKQEIQNAVDSGSTKEKIELSLEEIEPAVQDENTSQASDTSKKYLSATPITITYNDKSWVADLNKIASWISYAAEGDKLVVNLDISNFTNQIAREVEVAAKDREIEDGTGKVIAEGQDGRGIDGKILTGQVKSALEAGKSATIALPVFDIPRGEKTVYPHAQPGRYEGRYIDINLSEQTLYAYEGSNQVNSFLVSTGKRGYGTPTGEFHIYGKDRYALMDGEDYYLPNVPFVSWFYGDYSIHGTYWHHNFGHVMSHGCVNASISDAEWIFGWADIGTPVYIHY